MWIANRWLTRDPVFKCHTVTFASLTFWGAGTWHGATDGHTTGQSRASFVPAVNCAFYRLPITSFFFHISKLEFSCLTKKALTPHFHALPIPGGEKTGKKLVTRFVDGRCSLVRLVNGIQQTLGDYRKI
ncbi:hypothetical protein BaRGS_00013113 [Batillaria attramentaria]|uniref:Uncharacterized protein n=1 Tax=Batillaria attramentaria TaxID=370345 RepID=A0ABD0L8S2_9CAEN